MAHAPVQDEVVKNTFANYAFEHVEIATYRALIALAQAVGATGDMAPCRKAWRRRSALPSGSVSAPRR